MDGRLTVLICKIQKILRESKFPLLVKYLRDFLAKFEASEKDGSYTVQLYTLIALYSEGDDYMRRIS